MAACVIIHQSLIRWLLSNFACDLTGVYILNVSPLVSVVCCSDGCDGYKFFLFVFAPDLLLTGEGWEGTQFVRRHPSVILHLLAFSVASALGQVSTAWLSVSIM